eukprot:TRINITY_DN5254_c0_g1_i1.p2 TRINITY_DN5254_c0_g1~~TRINITY_DN5254_c0_g1_i1.p2  ORF type:complete len:105 (+),score=19.87 TRINITY_DN5254_c0_g1_i1:259-573(+)
MAGLAGGSLPDGSKTRSGAAGLQQSKQERQAQLGALRSMSPPFRPRSPDAEPHESDPSPPFDGGSPAERLSLGRVLFDSLDLNKDGQIDKHEFATARNLSLIHI